MAITSPVRTSITIPAPPIALNSPIARANSSRTTACTFESSDSFNGAGLLASRLLKNSSTPADPCPSTVTPPSTCAATLPSG